MDVDGSQSWKERCDRYFSSLTDSEEKDGGQEKDLKHQTNNDSTKYPGHNVGDENEWKSLSQFHKKATHKEGRTLQFIRKTLATLDIHGTRFAAKSPNVVELWMWIVIVLAAIGATSFLIYLQLHHFYHTPSYFDTVNIAEQRSIDLPSVSFCNLNPLKKSSIHGTKFKDLLILDNQQNVLDSLVRSQPRSVEEILRNYSTSLLGLIDNLVGNGYIDFMKDIGQEYMIQNNVPNADITSLYELSLTQGPGTLRDLLAVSLSEMRDLGFARDDIIAQCWVSGRPCKDSEITMTQDRYYGNCFTVNIDSALHEDVLEVVVDAQQDEYIYALSPTVGVAVKIHPNGTEGGVTMTVNPEQTVQIDVQSVRETSRLLPECEDSQQYNKEVCLTSCLNNVVVEQCQCSYLDPNLQNINRCTYNHFSQYVCMRAVEKLHLMGVLPCDCAERCRTTEYTVFTSSAKWPSDGGMIHVMKSLKRAGRTLNSSYIRSNMAKVQINTKNARKVMMEEKVSTTVLELLVKIGGISALIVGVSMLSLGELLWTVIRVMLHASKHCNTQSDRANAYRLTDSEITSITWAIHREKRKAEEKQQDHKAKPAEHKLSGNAQSRINIARRNSSLRPIAEEKQEKLNNRPVAKPSSDSQSWEHERQRRYLNNSKNRQHSSEFPVFGPIDNRVKVPFRSRTPDNNDNGRSNVLQMEGVSRSGSVTPNQMYPERGRIITPTDAIQLYGGSSAYFHSNSVTEPLYL